LAGVAFVKGFKIWKLYIEIYRNTYENYVPLYRDLGTENSTGIGKGVDIRGKEVKKAKGSEKRVISPISNLFYQQERALTRSIKNDIGKTIVEATEEYPELKDLFEVKAQKYIPRFNKDGEMQFKEILQDDGIWSKETYRNIDMIFFIKPGMVFEFF